LRLRLSRQLRTSLRSRIAHDANVVTDFKANGKANWACSLTPTAANNNARLICDERTVAALTALGRSPHHWRMSRIFDIAYRYVDQIAALDPILATDIGVPGHEREMTDFSPDGVASIAAFNRRSVAELETAPTEDGRADRIARSVMLERLGVHLDLFEAGEHFRDLNNIASPLQNIRQVFDQMPRSTEEEWANIAARLQLVPDALARYRRTLTEGVRRGTPAARRQALEGARQARVWGSDGGFFAKLAARFDAAEAGPETLRTDVV